MKKTNKRITPDFVTELSMCEVFVFGSNLEGCHGGGAARIAYERFGAVWGQGVGPQGKSYAIPTMHGPISSIKPYVDDFIEYAKQHPYNRFLLTRIGCGIAGFKDKEMAPLFAEVLDIPNVSIPKEWLPIIIACPQKYKKERIQTPAVINEDVLKILCDQYKYSIGAGIGVSFPDIRIRYVIDEDKFGYACFGDFFFYGQNLYVFSTDDDWAEKHNQGVVLDYFKDECFGRGYAHKVIFGGVRTGYQDANKKNIYTGDVCRFCLGGNEYSLPLATIGSLDEPEYFKYAFALDNHCIFPEDCKNMTSIGTVLYQLDKEFSPEKLNERCARFADIYGLSHDTVEQRLTMSKYTPSFHVEPWKYTAMEELGVEYNWTKGK